MHGQLIVWEIWLNRIGGNWKEIVFVFGSPNADNTVSELYYAFWGNLSAPVSIVLTYTKANDRKMVVGWRGFIISEGENADSHLLSGDRCDNEFGFQGAEWLGNQIGTRRWYIHFIDLQSARLKSTNLTNHFPTVRQPA